MLDAEFERRSPERYRSLHRVIHDHVVAGLRAATGPDRQLLAQHLLYLHRKSPLTAVFYALRAQGSAAVVPARRPRSTTRSLSIIEAVRGSGDPPGSPRAGSPSSPTPSAWCGTSEGVAGFAYHVLHPTGSAMEHRDPVVRAVLDHVAAAGPVRPGEQVDIARFLSGRREHQRDRYAVLAGPVSSLVAVGVAPARVVVRGRRSTPSSGGRSSTTWRSAGCWRSRSAACRMSPTACDWRRFPFDRGST